MWFARPFALVFASIVAFSTTAQAVILDWDGKTWTPGSLSNSYDVDGSPGNDLTVTVSGSTGTLQPEIVSPYPQTPAITTDFDGGFATGTQSTLSIAVNFTSQSDFITVTIDFSALYTAGVENVSFTLFDFDYANSGSNTYQDQLRSITATSIDGTTLIAPTITTGATNSLSGTGLTQVVNGTASAVDIGAGSNAGNVTISFGTAAIRSFTFTYGSGSGTVANPTYQHVGLYDISFTPIPEINPAWSAVVSCLAVAALILRHRANLRK